MDKLNCLYLDYTARIFDAQVTEVMGFPANEFLQTAYFRSVLLQMFIFLEVLR